MGCASSTLLSQDDDFSQIGGSASFTHHIVSLTSTTYGLLTLDPPTTTTPPPRITLASLFPSPLSEPRSLRYEPINSWDLMSGLDPHLLPSSRISSQPFIRPNSKPTDSLADKQTVNWPGDEENSCPNVGVTNSSKELGKSSEGLIDRYEMICPPNGENKVVVYTTTLRGVRKTFDDCNAVRSAIEGMTVFVCERDISMDKGFREELRELMSGRERDELIPPRVEKGYVCEGCGGARFLPCFSCNGSCKMVVAAEEDVGEQGSGTETVRCSKCNENGLVHCPLCT